MRQYNNKTQEMISFDYITKKKQKRKKHNPN